MNNPSSDSVKPDEEEDKEDKFEKLQKRLKDFKGYVKTQREINVPINDLDFLVRHNKSRIIYAGCRSENRMFIIAP